MFWKNKKVLVTGHTGFKGSWLSLWLAHNGADVYGLSLPPTPGESLYHILGEEDHYVVSKFFDIADQKCTADFIKDIQPEIVFHLAAQSLVRPSYSDPVETFRTNALGTAHVLDAIRETISVKAAIIITSDKCYDNPEKGRPFTENDKLGGSDPYSASKACAEIIVASYRKSFFQNGREIGIATARAGNVIGGGDWSEDRLIPDVVRSLSTSRTITLRYPKSIRPWQHVLEPLSGYIKLCEKLYSDPQKYSHAWNFGPYEEAHKEVGWIVKNFAEQWGEKLEITSPCAEILPESRLLSLDSSLAINQLDWKPRLEIKDALAFTVNWYKKFLLDPQDMKRYSIEQIESFISLK